MQVTTMNKASGEMIELPADTPDEIVNAYRIAQNYEKVAVDLKNQLKELIPNLLDEQGRSQVIDKYQFKRIETQRQTYAMPVLREVFDEDEISLFLKVQKKLVDDYVKEHRDKLTNEQFDTLKHGLVPDGNVITMIRLEKVMS